MSAWSWRNPVFIGIAALIAVIIAAATFAIVPETQQAVILRFEQPVGDAINRYQPGQAIGRSGAGLIVRVPFIDRIVWVDKRVLNLDLEDTPVLSTDQIRVNVDAFARFRVVDPLRMVVTAGSELGVENQLKPIFGSALRNELGKRQFAELLSPERGRLMDNIQAGLQRDAQKYGVEIVDVRIKHADLPVGSPLDSALRGMQVQRQQEANTIRARGQRDAQIVRAQSDADAARIYADAFGRDPEFYNFYRAMQSYRRTFGADGNPPPSGSTSFVLGPDNAYLKEFAGRDR
ncbi:protease modulator HflC [Sphingomonas aerophila]|jgi:membrane protease subunit HflC|uniref:Protein HflC n=1 Tax=Sphingomonas aerophila TaxID=1344948 RepID=A0A7W9EV95_9SPHN|nr:protease modulator HflC [Sphingomonas aerophila]MBB5714263.1 membrane protease subunit HflC [Sphingomonas aerophila]